MQKLQWKNLKWQVLFLVISCLTYAPLLGNKARNPDGGVILPPLFAVKSPFEYLSMLANFEVIDFQPVRDITFFIDIFIFNHFGIVSFASTNVVLWGIAGFFLFKLFQRIFTRDHELQALVWTTAFMVYPLFTQAVPWGMARKHILAFVFILWATNSFLDWIDTGKSFFKSYIGYVLACLSHPIFILWPVWALIHHALVIPESRRAERKSFWIFFVTMAVLLFTHWAYYTIGNQNVAEVFGMAKPQYDLEILLLNFLFYFRQMLYPYELTFQNYPSQANAWPGLILLGLVALLVFLQRRDRKILSWVIFLFFPFPIFLTLPAVYDQYLILPVAGIMILIISKWPALPRYVLATILGVSLVWGVMTFREAVAWVKVREIAERNFINSPSCKSAAVVMMNYYTDKKKAPADAVKFFNDSFCNSFHPDAPMKMRVGYTILESLMLYYEDELFTYEFRTSRLEQLAQTNYFPDLILASIFSKEGKNEEIENIARKIIEKSGGAKLQTGLVIDDVLRPYCLKEKLESCITLTEPNSEEIPYL